MPWGFGEVMAEMYRLLGWEQLFGARRIKANRIIQELVLARIAQPLSKRTVRELDRFGDLSLNLEQVYNTMDDLNDDVIESICQQSHFFYDTTTLYFESDRCDSLRDSYSKDGKHHRVQLVFACRLDLIFPGSKYEGHTSDATKTTRSEDNGIAYVMGARLKSQSESSDTRS